MKTLLKKLSATLLVSIAVISCNTEDLQNLQQQIDELKSNQIASIDTQVAGIKASIANLETTDTELRGYIATLQEQQSTLVAEDQKLAQAIADAKASLSSEITAVEAGLIAQLEAYKATVEGQIASLNTAIENLQAQDIALKAQIAELKTYTDKEIQNTKDWASATFVTLEKYNETTALIGVIQGQITSINTQMEEFQTSLSNAMTQILQLRADLQQSITDNNTALTQTAEAITAAYTTAIASAIATSETSLQSWVNTQLTGYYTAVQTDAKLAALQAEQEQKLNQQKTYVEGLLVNLQTVLEGKISSNSALIEGLQGQVNNLSAEAGTLAHVILDNADSIAVNAAQINANAQAIAQNSSEIILCETLIATNKELIAANARAIAANDTAILALQAQAAASEQGIANNVENIAKNAADIAANASLIAANATAISNNTTAIADNAAAIAQLRTDLQTTMSDLTAGYQTAIATAINTLDGKLSGELAEQVTTLNTRISQEVEAINTAITALQARVADCEEEITNIKALITDIQAAIDALRAQVSDLLARIQSVSYVPRYDDGKATVAYLDSAGISKGIAILDFKIKPSGTAAKLAEVWQNALSAEVVYTQTRVNEMDTLPVVGVEASGDILTVAIDGSKLNQAFFTGTKKVSVALVISDGNNDRTSDYVPIVPQAALSDLSITADEDCAVFVSGELHKDLLTEMVGVYFLYGSTEATLEELISNGEGVLVTRDGSGQLSAAFETTIGYHKGVIKIQAGNKAMYGDIVSFDNIPEPVDMGLSVKWASFNIGGSNSTDYGGYYAWGELKEKDEYYEDSYIFGKYPNMTKYCRSSDYGAVDNRSVLEPSDDIATQQLGDKWRIPREEEWSELLDENNCTWLWTSRNNRNGHLVTSKITGNSIFLVAGGYKGDNDCFGKGDNGSYWSSTVYYYQNYASRVDLYYDHYHPSGLNRNAGLSVRPVYGERIMVESISLRTNALSLTVEGGETTLSARVLPENAHEKGLVWTSSNPSIVKVNKEGIVTPISTGSATITVTSVDGGFTDECLVTVGEPSVPEIVDMGLSVKWASWNLGAFQPEGYGGYYAWGESETKQFYDWSTYKWSAGSWSTLNKYCTSDNYGSIDHKTLLDSEDDAASVILGDDWRTPTDEEWTELRNTDNCTWLFTSINGVNGYLITSKVNGNSIFLSAAGYKGSNGHLYAGEVGRYWSASINEGNDHGYARAVNFNSSEITRSSYYRYFGRSIRPVYSHRVHVEGVTLSAKKISLDVGENFSLSADTTPSNALDKSVIWSSDNPEAVVVDQMGMISAESAGTAIIAVMTVDGGFTDECLVTVGEPAVPEAVDMGLSVKWATWNIGTYCPEGRGYYYSWGEIETKDYYHWETYKWCNGSETTMFKYCKENAWGTIDNKSILETEDDVAAVMLGGNWRMPTSEEWMELLNEETCIWSWTTRNHVDGYLVTSKITGNSIFLPAAGARYFDEINRVGEEGYYWSSTLYPGASRSAWQVSIKNHDDHLSHRYNGISVRPVCPE